MRRLDVLAVFREAWPWTGGLGIDICQLARGLAARGHRVQVASISTGDPREAETEDELTGVEFIGLRPYPGRRLGVEFGLAPGVGRLIDARRPSIVHVFSCLPVYLHFTAMLAARRAGLPLVWTPMMHPVRQRQWQEYGAQGLAMRAFDAIGPRAARLADAVIAATEEEAEAFRAAGGRRVEVIPPAVSPTDPPSEEQVASFRDRFGVSDEPLVLLVAGRDERRKGLDFAARSMRVLRDALPAARMLVVGDSIDGLRAADSGVIAAGRLSGEDLECAYSAADVAFVPSRYEAFSRIVIEAWQHTTPVVVTSRVGLAEAVRDRAGGVVPFGDPAAAAEALRRRLVDRGLAQSEGAAGRALVEDRFLLSQAVAKTSSLYEELVGAARA